MGGYTDSQVEQAYRCADGLVRFGRHLMIDGVDLTDWEAFCEATRYVALNCRNAPDVNPEGRATWSTFEIREGIL